MDKFDLLKSHIDQYNRSDGTVVQAHDDKRVAAQPNVPPIATHAKALRESSKSGDLDHESNQIAAGHMEKGDHKALAGHIKNLDTAARDHILDHVHPDHREGLGFKQLDMDRSKKQYAEKFPANGKPNGGAAKPAPVAKTQNEGYGFHGEARNSHLQANVGENYDREATEAQHVAAKGHADKQFAEAANHLVDKGHFKDHDEATKFLDSKSGRHLHNETDGDLSKSKWLPSMVKHYKAGE